jgi:hypothetical protein
MTLTQTDVVGLIRPIDSSNASYPENNTDDDGINSNWFYLGTNESIDTFEVSNNVQRVNVLGDRNAETTIEQQFEGSFSVSFDLTHDESVLGSSALDDDGDSTTAPDPIPNGFEFLEGIVTAKGGGSNDEEVDTQDSEDTFNFDDDPNWFELVIDQPDANTIVIARGCVATSLSFEVNVDETVTVTMDGFFADTDTKADIIEDRIDNRVNADPYTFDEAKVSHNGAEVFCPQGFTIDVENNVTPARCLGNRTSQHISAGNVNPSVSITELVDESSPTSYLDRALGGSNVSSADTNEQSTSTITLYLQKDGVDEVSFKLGGALMDTFSYSGISSDAEEVEAEISEVATGLTIDTNLT